MLYLPVLRNCAKAFANDPPPPPVDSEVHDRWRFVIQLCSVYGLRPEELRYLVIKDGVSGAELWTTDRKSMGGTKGAKTEPRMLHPLLLRDPDGTAIDWNLQARLQEGE